LVESVVDVLRAQIGDGRWIDFLPGERLLCHELQVSRPTLRLALKVLERDGCVSAEHGRKRRINLKPNPRAKGTVSNVIALLAPVSLDALPPFVLFWIDEVRSHLAKVGHHLEFHVSSACAAQQPDRALDVLVQSNPAALWILLLSSHSVQRWFAEHQVPCLVTGSCAPGAKIPSIDIDYRAACRHAAGMFHQRGHQQLALVIPSDGLAGDADSEAGFVEGCSTGPQPLVLRHDGSRENLIRKLQGALRLNTPPTGFLVARAGHVLTVVSYLMQTGARLPDEFGVISRDDEPFLDFMSPTIARYKINRVTFARRLARTVLQMVRSGSGSTHPIRLIPNLVTGGTL
jgi:DNA-binding LacI/PurR family transcriptional regulator